MLKPLTTVVLLGATLSATAFSAAVLPASAAVDNHLPVRWNTAPAVWSTNLDGFTTFISTGAVTDRGLAGGISRSGWTASELRSALSRSYSVDVVGVSRFLYSEAGVKFLKNQTRSYFPYGSMTPYPVQALRVAILTDAADGSISSAGIMAALPTDFRPADTCGTYDGKQNLCAEGKCQGEAQCTSLLSWFVFLPACLQANQRLDPVAQVRVAPAPAPVHQPEPVSSLW